MTQFTRPLGPFAILYQQRSIPNSKAAPKKTGPKPNLSKTQQAAQALETPQERALRHALRNHSPSFNVAIPSAEATARTNSIAGRALDARFQ